MSEFETEEIITYPAFMLSLLRRLHGERAMVSVRIGRDNNLYNSIVLDVFAAEGRFALDELTPHRGHKKLRRSSQVRLEARLKGGRVVFTSEIEAIEEDNSIPMYVLPLPDQMAYRQRRRHYRARLGGEQHLFISLPLPFRNQIRGELVDISASGVCSRINYADSTRLEQEQAIHAATINLPGRNQITCDLEVRSIRHFPEQGFSLVGSEFIAIPSTLQTHVERIVAMLDRQQRRVAHF